MFLIDNLLAAPGNGLMFVFKELARKAQEEWLDDDGLKKELHEMYALFEAGRISEREFEEKEYRIVERLQQIAKAKYQQKWGAAEPEPAPEPEPEIFVETDVHALSDAVTLPPQLQPTVPIAAPPPVMPLALPVFAPAPAPEQPSAPLLAPAVDRPS